MKDKFKDHIKTLIAINLVLALYSQTLIKNIFFSLKMTQNILVVSSIVLFNVAIREEFCKTDVITFVMLALVASKLDIKVEFSAKNDFMWSIIPSIMSW